MSQLGAAIKAARFVLGVSLVRQHSDRVLVVVEQMCALEA